MNLTQQNVAPQALVPPASDMFRHIVSRLMPMAEFASKRMEPAYRKSYLHTIWHIHEYLVDNFPRAQHKTLFDAFQCIDDSLKAVPTRKYGLWGTITGRFAQDMTGRRLAVTHTLDLALSYRRFIGVPISSISYEQWAKDIVIADLESLLSQIEKSPL